MANQNQSKFNFLRKYLIFNKASKGISTPIAILIVVVLAVAVGGIAIWQSKWQIPAPQNLITEPSKVDCSVLKKEIKQEIEKANYCEKDKDCISKYTGGKTGLLEIFGCYIFINKNANLTKFNNLKGKWIEEECSLMINKCPEAPPLACINNKCVPKSSEKVTITTDKTEDETTDNWKTAKIKERTGYVNKDYSYEIKYPQNWDYVILEIPNSPAMFAPKDIIAIAKQSFKNITNDKLLTLWISVYDKIVFERGILPYRGKSTEYIRVTSSNIDVSGIKGRYYISEYIKDKSSYKAGDKFVTVDLAINDIYFSFDLFDYQYLKVFDQILSTFRFLK